MGPHHVVGEISKHPVETEHACNSPEHSGSQSTHMCHNFRRGVSTVFSFARVRGVEKEKKEKKKKRRRKKKEEKKAVVATATNLQANTEHESTDCSDKEGDIEEAVYRLPAFLSAQ